MPNRRSNGIALFSVLLPWSLGTAANLLIEPLLLVPASGDTGHAVYEAGEPSRHVTEDRFGIGAAFGAAGADSGIVVLRCIPRGPAERAGLLAGDVVEELDGSSVAKLTLDSFLGRVTSDSAGTATLRVRRGEIVLTLTIGRERFKDIYARIGRRIEGDGLAPLVETKELAAGDRMPSLELRDLHCDSLSLDLGERRTIVYFWASWCEPCKRFMGKLGESTSALRLVSVSVEGTCEEFVEASRRTYIPGEAYWSGNYGQAAQLFRAYRTGIPIAVLVEGNRVSRIAMGADSCHALWWHARLRGFKKRDVRDP
jgi:thiol-disulfide isomerase/thioredoxin